MKERELFHLSHPQKRIWYIEKINPDQSVHNIGGVVKIKGKVDFTSLNSSINFFIETNSGIRHRFIETEGNINQYIKEYQHSSFPLHEFNNDEELDQWVKQQSSIPFNLYDSDLYEFHIFTLKDSRESGYFIKVHHIVSDGWSMNIMTKDIAEHYVNLTNNVTVSPSNRTEYNCFLEKEKEYISSKLFLRNKKFWNNKFTPLPDRSEKIELSSAEGKRRSYELSYNQSEKIKRFVQKIDVSEYSFFVALYYIYMHKTERERDITIGMPVLNRFGKKEKDIVGMLASTMPFRYTIDDYLSIEELLIDINRNLTHCYFNQKYPYDLLVQDLELKKKGYGDLFGICINYYNTNLPTNLDGLQIENKELYNGTQIYDLQMVIRSWSEGLFNLDLDYKVHKYSDIQIEMMFKSILFLIDQIIDSPQKTINDIEVIPHLIKHKMLYEYNKTAVKYPQSKTIYELFERQVKVSPEEVALDMKGEKITYRELNRKSNQLARYLIKSGVTRNNIIGILMKHSIETIIGIIAVLKTGSAYLPIDFTFPSKRINYMIEDSKLSFILTNLNVDKLDIPKQINIVNVNSKEIYIGNAGNLHVSVDPQDLAYIIYTSGSTGEPKGTMVTHQGLVNYTTWAVKEYIGCRKEVFPLYSSISFDLTITSIFPPLISGNQIVIYPQNENEYVLHQVIKDKKATIIKLTPSHLTLLLDLDANYSTIKTMIVGGENFSTSLAIAIQEKFGPSVKIFNEYGPSETVVGCMIHEFNVVQDKGTSVPIGKPIQNTEIYLLDSNLQPVPMGEKGEIYISGAGVSKGYLNRSELTEERFINNPFSNNDRMYKTGDLAKFIDLYTVEYLGREDDQIKLQGFRIERTEIENLLLQYPEIKDTIVIDFEDQNHYRYLCAYFTAKSQLASADLVEFLESRLPTYMIPSYYIQLDEIPLTVNGKVDRQALPKIKNYNDNISNNIESSEAFLNTVSDILNVENVEMTDNFYYLGGDSIKAIQLSSKLSEKGLSIKIKDILANPIMKDMLLHLEKAKKSFKYDSSPCYGELLPLPAHSWFLERQLDNINHYTQSVLLNLTSTENMQLLIPAIQYVVNRHDSFRLNYDEQKNTFYFNDNYIEHKLDIETHNLKDLSVDMQMKRLVEIGEIAKKTIDITKDFLFKALILQLGNQNVKILLIAHHIAVDGVSWRIILEDIYKVHKQLESGKKAFLPPVSNNIQEWALHLKLYSENISQEEKEYWSGVYTSKAYNQQVNDFNLGKDLLEDCEIVTESLAESTTFQLLNRANETYNTKASELMIIALSMALSKYMREENVVIEIEGHGREEISGNIDVSTTVGWFTSLYPVVLNVKEGNLQDNIKNLKEQLRNVPNKGMSHGVLKYLSEEINFHPKKLIRFNYLGDFDSIFSNKLFNFIEEESGAENSKTNELDSLIDINSYVFNKKLTFSFTYSRKKFESTSIRTLIKKYVKELNGIISHCCSIDNRDFTPSDFDTIDLSNKDLESIFNME